MPLGMIDFVFFFFRLPVHNGICLVEHYMTANIMNEWMLIMTINKMESDGEACHCQSLKWINVDGIKM